MSENFLMDRNGNDDFNTLIESGKVYVDKTRLIDEMLTADSHMLSLARPRRFGKTLLISTLEQVLLARKKNFRNCYICSSQAKYDWQSSHVIRLNMAQLGVKSDNFHENLLLSIKDIAKSYGIVIKQKSAGPALSSLINSLYKLYDKIPLVPGDSGIADMPEVSVLVDDYDYQYNANYVYNNDEQAINQILREFYLGLKAAADNGMVRLSFITGISISNILQKIYGADSTKDLTFSQNYSTICGFTEEEIKLNYGNKIYDSINILREKNRSGNVTSPSELIDFMSEWYGGYSWDGISKVIRPESVLDFFKSCFLNRKWYETASYNYFQLLNMQDKDYFKLYTNSISHKCIVSSKLIKEISPASMLLTTGYLTVEKIIPGNSNSSETEYQLTIPNNEVRMRFLEENLVPRINYGIEEKKYSAFNDLTKKFSLAVCDRDSINAEKYLAELLTEIPLMKNASRKSYYHLYLDLALAYVRGRLSSQVHVAGGTIDYLVEMPNDIIVINIKILSQAKFNQIINKIMFGKMTILDETGKAFLDKNASDLSGKKIWFKELFGREHDATTPVENSTEGKPIIKKLLTTGIRKAFATIDKNGYATGYLVQGKKVWAAAISIVDKKYVRIEFKEVSNNNPES